MAQVARNLDSARRPEIENLVRALDPPDGSDLSEFDEVPLDALGSDEAREALAKLGKRLRPTDEGSGTVWIGESGEVNVEALWEDPWQLFAEDLHSRIGAIDVSDVDSLEIGIYNANLLVMADAHSAFSPRNIGEEAQFVGVALERQIIFKTIADDIQTGLIDDADQVPLRWRRDAVTGATLALECLLNDQEA
jgi:hypothetical protein